MNTTSVENYNTKNNKLGLIYDTWLHKYFIELINIF